MASQHALGRGSASRGKGSASRGRGSASRGKESASKGEVGLHLGGARSASRGVRQTPSPIYMGYTGYGQRAGGTHPTGMHSSCQ